MEEKDFIEEKIKEEKKIVDQDDLKEFEENVKIMEKQIQDAIDKMNQDK